MCRKKELVIICNNCYPIPSATGLLALNCVRYLKERYNIRVVTIQQEQMTSQRCIDDYELYMVGNWRLKLFYKYQTKLKRTTGVKRRLFKALYDTVRLLGKLDRTFCHMDSYKWFERKAYRVVKQLNKERKIDAIISVSEPIRAHLVAERVKKSSPNIWWVCYWGDLFATEYFKSNIFINLRSMEAIEKRLIKTADYVLCNDEIFTHYRKLSKSGMISAVPYTLKEAILNLELEIQDSSTPITFIYYGSFSETMRNPEKMLEIFAKSNYKLDLYSAGCENIVQRYVESSNGRIRSHGFVKHEELCKKVMKSSVLINIGNSDSDFIPSKTLELMSYRKPIIDFYYGNNATTPISAYPALLRIQNDVDTDTAISDIDSFVSTCFSSITPQQLRVMFSHHTEEKVQAIVGKALKEHG